MTRVSLKGVVLGGLVDVVASVLVYVVLLVGLFFATDVIRLPEAAQAAALLDAWEHSFWFGLASGTLSCLCSVLGGYVSARIANHDHLLNGALSSFLCVGLGLATLAAGMVTESWWMMVLLFVLSPALGALGGYLRLRGTPPATSSPALGSLQIPIAP